MSKHWITLLMPVAATPRELRSVTVSQTPNPLLGQAISLNATRHFVVETTHQSPVAPLKAITSFPTHAVAQMHEFVLEQHAPQVGSAPKVSPAGQSFEYPVQSSALSPDIGGEETHNTRCRRTTP